MIRNEFLNYFVVLNTLGCYGDVHRASNYCFIHPLYPSVSAIVLFKGMKQGIFTKKEAKKYIDKCEVSQK